MSNLLNTLRARRSGSAKNFDAKAVWLRAIALAAPTRSGDGLTPGWLQTLVRLSDDGLRVPGTPVRVGLDAVLGALLPGLGDALGGATAATVMYVAWRRGAPRELLFRMLGNASVDIAFGAIPIVGDIFDLGFHANRRNLSLLEEHMQQRSRALRASKASAIAVFLLLGAAMLLGFVIVVTLVVVAWRHWS